jgi:hypothetical protein
MTPKYSIEVWIPNSRKYILCYESESLTIIEKMLDKPYYLNRRRRVIRTETEVLYTLPTGERVKE